MSTNDNLLKFDEKAFLDFVKFEMAEKHRHLMNHGLLIDTDEHGETLVNLYFLSGFFVEETLSRSQYEVLDIIPYKHGYRISSFVEVKQVLVPRIKAQASQ